MKSIFCELQLNNFDTVLNMVLMDGKKKSVCPIRFFTEEQIKQLNSEQKMEKSA